MTKKSLINILGAVAMTFAVACDGNGSGQGTSVVDDPPEQNELPEDNTDGWVQIEQLARPGINEALLITPAFLNGYNATAPTFAGVPDDVLGAVVGEVQTVLKAFYLSACLINGALGLDPASGVKPAGLECHVTGPAVWEENALDGVTLTQASQDASLAYANRVISQFIPDVLRIDVSAPSGYLTLCGAAEEGVPLLCGGRKLQEDVIDITYNYLLAGAQVTKGPYNQVNALVSDGVQFSSDDSQNSGNVTLPDPSNTNQFHPLTMEAFPYSAAPL